MHLSGEMERTAEEKVGKKKGGKRKKESALQFLAGQDQEENQKLDGCSCPDQ